VDPPAIGFLLMRNLGNPRLLVGLGDLLPPKAKNSSAKPRPKGMTFIFFHVVLAET